MDETDRSRRFSDGSVVDEEALQRLLDAAVMAAADDGAATGVLLRLRPPSGSLTDRQRHLAAVEARLVARRLAGSGHAAALAVVEAALAVDGTTTWGPVEG